MKEHPILFSGPMVKAIIDGRKSQTRRVIKPQPSAGSVAPHCENGWWMWRKWTPQNAKDGQPSIRLGDKLCPYGVPGDRLWVREAWAVDAPLDQVRREREDMMQPEFGHGPYYRATEVAPDTLTWRPSIHMPRWASRITLEVAGVRVERLNDASDTDILCEGVESRDIYVDLWNRLNSKRGYPWEKNCWVWVLEFRKVSP